MSIIIGILTVLEVIVCLLLSLVVLAQKPRQDGLGAAFGSGLMDQYAGAHATNVLQKATVYLGVALFALTFLLAILISRADQHRAGGKLVDPSDLNKAKAAETTTTPAAGAQPTPAQAEALKKAILDKNAADKAAGTKPAAGPAPAPAPSAQKPADTKSATPAPAPAPTPAAQQKPANATPAPAPAPQKPADATPAPAPAAPANK